MFVENKKKLATVVASFSGFCFLLPWVPVKAPTGGVNPSASGSFYFP